MSSFNVMQQALIAGGVVSSDEVIEHNALQQHLKNIEHSKQLREKQKQSRQNNNVTKFRDRLRQKSA